MIDEPEGNAPGSGLNEPSFESRRTPPPTVAVAEHHGVKIEVRSGPLPDGQLWITAEIRNPFDGRQHTEWWKTLPDREAITIAGAVQEMRRRIDELFAAFAPAIRPSDPLVTLREVLLRVDQAPGDSDLWHPNYAIGVLRIDTEHRLLVGLLARLARLLRDGRHLDKVKRLLVEIKRFAEFHFISEENLMHDVLYPGRVMHERMHSDLRHELSCRVARVQDGWRFVDSVHEFLVRWIVSHMAHEDRRLGDYVRTAGAPASE